MANIVSTTKESLKKIFDKVNRAYFFPENKTSGGAVKALGALSGGLELPLLAGSVTFNTGAPEKQEVKLTDNTTWLSKFSQGESDISMKVSSVHDDILELFLEKKADAVISAAVQIGDFDYTGQGYASSAKKTGGALVLVSSDSLQAVYLPDVEIGASFEGDGGDDSTGALNLSITPLTDANGAGFYILDGVAHSNG